MGNFASWAAFIIDPNQKLLLIAEDVTHAKEAHNRLERVGLGRVIGYSLADEAQWRKEGLNLASILVERCEQIQRTLQSDSPLQLVDVRSDSLDLGALFDGHIAREFADQDVDATMETMIPEPYVQCVPTMMRGFGGQGVRRFYSEHFVNQMPNDAQVTPISRTVGKDQVVDELSEFHPRLAVGLPAARSPSHRKAS
jgi:hypothetical protein